ncbi:MAG: DNA topoisomerase I [Candidatus Diapherotrites archaeon]|nr:DNA topoisomerase I [Candidatus Diapherotrites archaeon]
MKLIISEKAIAGKKIAEIISGGRVTEKKVGTVPVFSFDESIVVPLKGHFVDVDYPSRYRKWYLSGVPEMVESDIEYKVSSPGIGAALKKYAKSAETCIIATDNDREGEAIGLEAVEILKEENPKIKITRARFSAITQKDLQKAFSDLGELDYNVAHSANARREIDLIWGAVLTRFVSIVSNRLGKDFLSVGRVQTPTLALVVDKEKEIRAFKPEKFWVVSALLNAKDMDFIAIHEEKKFTTKDAAKKVFEKKSDTATVTEAKRTERTIPRPTPFNTTAFLRAATALGMTASSAMSVAESLYMSGFISYPRTDTDIYAKNVDLNEIMKELAKSKSFGDAAKYALAGPMNPTAGKKDAKDHPPIHPVALAQKSALDERSWKVYELVCRHFIATLSVDGVMDTTKLKFNIAGEAYLSDGQVIKEPGWTQFYPYYKPKLTELPYLEKGDTAKVKDLNLKEDKTKPPGRYSQGSLIKKMEDLGLGTKATRAEIIKKLYDRGYLTGSKSVEPTEVSFVMIDSLEKYANEVTTSEMTSKLESEMDEIGMAQKKKEEVVKDSRDMLKKIVEALFANKDKISTDLKTALKGQSIVGKCNVCGGNLLIRTSRFGKRFIGCDGYPKCTNTYPLPPANRVVPTGKVCPECGTPIVKVFSAKRRVYEMCIKYECPTKADWGKKKESKDSDD